MTLREIIAGLEAYDDQSVICMRRPWGGDAECRVERLDESLAIPTRASEEGFDYFLETSVAAEVLGALGSRPASVDDKIALLVFYAQNDAYPDWVYGGE